MKTNGFRMIASLALAVTILALVLAGCPAPTTQPAQPAQTPKPPQTPQPTPAAALFKWPERLSLVSSTGVGNAQWISYTAIMSKETGMDIRVVPEGAPALRFKAVKKGEYLATAGSNSDFQNAIEALETYATADGGPFQMRILWSTGMAFSGYLVRKDSGIKSVNDIKPGIRVGDHTASPGIREKQIPSLMAWAKVPMDQVKLVPFSTYDAMIRGLGENKIDLTFAFPTSPVVLELGDAVRFVDMPADTDPAGAKRFLEVDPIASFAKVLEGPPYLIGANAKGSATASVTREESDADLVYNFAKWLDTNYDKYKDAHPQNKYMTMDTMVQLVNTTFVPVHPGTIRYLKEKGVWTADNDARQKQNIDFITQYVSAYQAAMKQAADKKIAVDSNNKDWISLWTDYKKTQKIPQCKTFVGLK